MQDLLVFAAFICLLTLLGGLALNFGIGLIVWIAYGIVMAGEWVAGKAKRDTGKRVTRPAECPACGHPSHRHSCLRWRPWWRRFLAPGPNECLCHYWDSRWGNQVLIPEGESEWP